MHSGHLGVQDASVGERLEVVEDNQLRKAKTVFRTHGIKYSLPVHGKVRVKLQCTWSRDNRSPY